jgi:hypothetical protein
MSHIVRIQTQVHDPMAIRAACTRMQLPEPVNGKARLFEAEVNGLLVQLPGWQFPAVIDTITGSVQFDNYGGHWGDPQHLDRFMQMYAVEKCRLEARKQGMTVTEQALDDGSIRLQCVEGRSA